MWMILLFLSDNKTSLHALRKDIEQYLKEKLCLDVKRNYSVYPVTDKICIDAFGYKIYRNRILLRKRIKQNFARAVARGASQSVIASYMGWAKHCNSKNLIKILCSNSKTLKLTNLKL